MRTTFGASDLTIEIDGDSYLLPDALTPGTRVKHHKAITAFKKVDEAVLKARRELRAAGKKADESGEGAVDPDYIKAEDALDAAVEKLAEPSRALVVELLRPSKTGAPIPDGIADMLADEPVIQYAQAVVGGSTVEPDPTS